MRAPQGPVQGHERRRRAQGVQGGRAEPHDPPQFGQLWMEDVMRDPGFRNHVAVQTQNTNTIFHPSSWFAWMAQFEFEFNPEKHSFKTEIAESKLLDFYAEEQARKDRCVDHKEYIESFGGLKWK